ncbi:MULTISPECIES: hypothetical protein [Rhizobium]|uniref:hypothetical protein n=1 Tax=Rhizobium TaxID=379 RepID=UPI0015BEE1EF|nr:MULTISPECIES: hypothetical protein [Rhizobium]MBY3359372.1 hypothetical protein [Rhizobium laguerreae]MBY5774237.1 hypothetical protein [Rhizobium leguminosarum]
MEFDPETKEFLLEKCPVCEKTLGMRFMGDVWCCDNCCKISQNGELIAVDLRQYRQQLVDERYWRHLDLATSLIDPTKEEQRRKVRTSLHADFGAIDDGTMFDFICAVARSIACRVDKKQTWEISAPVLASAAEVIEGWPATFSDLVARDPGGERHHLNHHFRYLFYYVRVPKSLREKMRAIERVTRMRAIGRQAFTTDYKPTTLNVDEYLALTRFREVASGSTSLEKLLALFRANRSVTDFCTSFGIAVPSLLDMTDDRVFPAELFQENRLLTFPEAAASFLARIVRQRCAGLPPAESVRLPQAVTALYTRGGDPWANVVRALLDGDIEYWISPEKRRSVLETVHIRDLNALQRILALGELSPDESYALSISAREASVYLRLWPAQITRINKMGILKPPYTRAILGRFASCYESGVSARIRLQLGGQTVSKMQLRKHLRETGINPVFDDAYKRAIWRRSDVNNAFSSIIKACV